MAYKPGWLAGIIITALLGVCAWLAQMGVSDTLATVNVASAKADTALNAVTDLKRDIAAQRKVDSTAKVLEDFKIQSQLVEIAKAVDARVVLKPVKPDTPAVVDSGPRVGP